MVLRINNAPILRRWQPHVGSRTTISFMNQHHGLLLSRGAAPRHPGSLLMLFESAHDEVRNKLLPSLKKRFRTAQLLSPAFLVRAYTSWFKLRAMVQERELKRAGAPLPKALLRRKPMSGFFAAVFAAQVCDRIDLYGFANWTKGSEGRGQPPYHYFDSAVGVTAVHSFRLALEVLQLMSQSLNMTIQ